LWPPVLDSDDPLETVTENYRQGLLNLDEVLATTPIFLENYLLNEVFTDMFPLGDKDSFAHYLMLVSRYGVVRLMLDASCANGQTLPTPRDMSSAVQFFCRQYQHDSSFSGHVIEALSEVGLARLETLYRFFRTQ